MRTLTDWNHPDQEGARQSAERIRSLAGKTILIKIGGELVEHTHALSGLAEDLLLLRKNGVNVVLCHGGGPQITAELRKRELPSQFVEGQRVTDAATLDVSKQILIGDINARILSVINSIRPVAVGLSGLSAQLYRAERKDPALGYVGNVTGINSGLINILTDRSYIPVIACIGADGSGQALNINADTAAAALAGGLQADLFFIFTNVEGIYRNYPDKNSLIGQITVTELKELLPSLSEGMIPKVQAAISGRERGVRECRIIDGRVEGALLRTLAGKNGGTAVL